MFSVHLNLFFSLLLHDSFHLLKLVTKKIKIRIREKYTKADSLPITISIPISSAASITPG